jgi:hypothetical protein
MSKIRTLYHFTSRVHLGSIMRNGEITTTESNLSMSQAHVGPDVVWLTSDPESPRNSEWWQGSFLDKTRIRITVEVPDAIRWDDWVAFHKIDKLWRSALMSVGGSPTWYVVERPVLKDEWVTVEEKTDEGYQKL